MQTSPAERCLVSHRVFLGWLSRGFASWRTLPELGEESRELSTDFSYFPPSSKSHPTTTGRGNPRHSVKSGGLRYR